MHFPRFQFGKLDKNNSTRTLKFGRFNKIVFWLGGEIAPPLVPPLATALERQTREPQWNWVYCIPRPSSVHYLIPLDYLAMSSRFGCLWKIVSEPFFAVKTLGIRYRCLSDKQDVNQFNALCIPLIPYIVLNFMKNWVVNYNSIECWRYKHLLLNEMILLSYRKLWIVNWRK